MVSIFVTGASGFIGSHFIRSALSSGFSIRALTRSPTELSQQCDSSLEIVYGDMLNPLPSWFDGIDILVNLAWSGVSPSKVPLSTQLQVNISATLQLLNLSVHSGVKRIIATGTSHEYGLTSDLFSFIPPYAPLVPQTRYASLKTSLFYLIRELCYSSNIELFYGRLFSVYGSGQNPLNFWPSLKAAATSGKDFPMSRGSQVTDFIHVSDAVRHLLTACVRNDIKPGCPHIVNIGSGNPVSLLDFAYSQWNSFNPTGRILPGLLPDRPSQPSRLVPSLEGLQIPVIEESP